MGTGQQGPIQNQPAQSEPLQQRVPTGADFAAEVHVQHSANVDDRIYDASVVPCIKIAISIVAAITGAERDKEVYDVVRSDAMKTEEAPAERSKKKEKGLKIQIKPKEDEYIQGKLSLKENTYYSVGEITFLDTKVETGFASLDSSSLNGIGVSASAKAFIDELAEEADVKQGLSFIQRFLEIKKALGSASPKLALLSVRMVLFIAEQERKSQKSQKTLYAIEPRLLFIVNNIGSIEHLSVEEAAKKVERAARAEAERVARGPRGPRGPRLRRPRVDSDRSFDDFHHVLIRDNSRRCVAFYLCFALLRKKYGLGAPNVRGVAQKALIRPFVPNIHHA
jgi:hypothetical protein